MALQLNTICEDVYADWKALEDMDLSSIMGKGKIIKVEIIKDFGFKLNDVSVPAYDEQNGYYSGALSISIDYGNFKLTTEVGNNDGIKQIYY